MSSTIDALIAQGPRPVEVDPNGVANRIITLRQAMQQQQMGQQQIQAAQMENQQRQIQMDQTRALNDAWKASLTTDPATGRPTIDRDLAVRNLAQAGAGSRAPEFLQAVDQMEKSHLDLQKAKGDLALQERNTGGTIGGAIKAAGYDPGFALTAFTDAERKGAIDPGTADPILAQIQQAQQKDPTGAMAKQLTQQIADHMISLSPQQSNPEAQKNLADAAKAQFDTAQQKRSQALQDLSVIQSPDDYAAWLKQYPDMAKSAPAGYSAAWVAQQARKAVPVKDQPQYDIDSMKARLGIMGDGEFDQYLAKYAQSKGTTPANMSPGDFFGAVQNFATIKKDPDMRNLAIANANLAEVMKQQQINQMPTREQAAQVAGDLMNHRIAPDQFSQVLGRDNNGAFRRMIYEEGKKLDPNFNFEQSASEYQLAKSPGFQSTVRYMDYAGAAMPRLMASASKLANGQVSSINQLVNAGKRQFQDVDLAAFNADRLDVADAIAKILQGGGTGAGTSDAKLSQAQSLIRESDSPAVVAATLNEVAPLIKARRQTLTRGTYLESVPNANALPDAGAKPLTVGQTVTIKGKQMKITAVHPDGSFDAK